MPGIAPVNYSYDANGFLTETEQGGRTTSYTYTPQGYLESATDPLGRIETTAYDSVGHVTTQTLPNGEQILYDYDKNGNLSSITPPGQPAHTFEYTEVDLTDSYAPPAIPDSAGGISYLYDKDKKLLSTVFSDSSSIQMVYDTTFSGSARPMEIIYDQGTTSFDYDSTSGNLTAVISSDSVITSYSYDGSLTTQISTDGLVNGVIDFTYNNDFQVISQTINGANAIDFDYDADGMLVRAGILSMLYGPQNGQLKSDTLNNITGSYFYNSFGELVEKVAEYNGANLYNSSFTHDSLGRITSINEVIEDDSTFYEYEYNDIGYLIEVSENGVTTAEYAYDANGNRIKYIMPSDTVTATYDDQDRMLSYGEATYKYGPRGDLQSKIVGSDTTTYKYDNLGNLRSVTLPDGNLIEYIVDGQDRRIAKKLNGKIIKRWLHADGPVPIAELDSAGNVDVQYGPGYFVKNDTTYRVLRDQLGSVRMIVNSLTGKVVQQIDYDSYGNITYQQNENTFIDIGYAGGLYDKDTGLTRFGARDYDPQTGRWTAKDPILFAGGTSNLYEYALNDPINNVDPNGLQPLRPSPSDSLSNSFYDIGLGAGATSAITDQYQKHLGQRYTQFYGSASSRSLPSARNLISNMEFLKAGKNFGGIAGAACTAVGIIADSQNPNVSTARTSYRAAVGVVSTAAGSYNPLLGLGIQFAGTGLEYGYDIGVTIANEFTKGLADTKNALRNRWVPTY